MKRVMSCLLLGSVALGTAGAQQKMTPELLWKLGRVSPEMVTTSGGVIFGVTRYDVAEDKSRRELFSVPVTGGEAKPLAGVQPGASGVQQLPGGGIGYTFEGQWWTLHPGDSAPIQATHADKPMENIRVSPDGRYLMFSRAVPVHKVLGKDIYPDLPKSHVQVYTNLMYRHWDKWYEGSHHHVFYTTLDSAGNTGVPVDIMQGEPYDCPTQPFGGAEDFIWAPDGQHIYYVCKKLFGKDYAVSTNSDIYVYDLATGKTSNFTEKNKGYDTAPAFSPDGKSFAWLQMKTDGYEADKNDLIVQVPGRSRPVNLTAGWDGTVNNFRWGKDSSELYFTAPVTGTIQLFGVKIAGAGKGVITQLTHGDFDVDGIVGRSGDLLVVSRQDMNHATELFTVGPEGKEMTALTTVNKAVYDQLALSRIERRWVATTDGKKELVWVIYPPGFDSTQKYPTLLYCQGGPQSEVSQFYSFRWNFQLMAAGGYIIVAPNRRGLPGFGVKWNAEISGDWGGQPMKDYLSAIDDVSRLPYVDTSRLGCVGASYGGYSVYMLAGIHGNRFKTFIAHDGLFDFKSWYGTTEEMWFANHDLGGPYWDTRNKTAQRSYQDFNPSNLVAKWHTPIMIIQGGIDYRVPVEQGLEAFQAAQLQGIKSKLLYFPKENHWVLDPQDAMVWQREFFRWLRETL